MDVPSQLMTKLRRSDLLRCSFGISSPVIRPPWSIFESTFQELCNGCDACINACKTSILRKARGGYPVVDFSKNECTFCGDCVDVCKPRALKKEADKRPWPYVATVTPSCLSSKGVTCRICGDNCQDQAITFRLAVGGRSTPTINISLCTGCGACVAPCPVDAIQIQLEEVRT